MSEAIVFSISSIQKVVQFSKSNPTNYLCIKYLQISYDEESRDVRRTSLLSLDQNSDSGQKNIIEGMLVLWIQFKKPVCLIL